MARKQRLYPFSMQKHAHDIEFMCNRVRNIMYDMEAGDIPYNEKEYDKLEEKFDKLTALLSSVLSNSRDGRISWLTGPEIALAKEAVVWAEHERVKRA